MMRDMAQGGPRVRIRGNEHGREAQKAITELNEYQLGGRGLTVNEARPSRRTPAEDSAAAAAATRVVADRSASW